MEGDGKNNPFWTALCYLILGNMIALGLENYAVFWTLSILTNGL